MTEFVNEHIATNLYFDNNFNMQAVKLLPGEYFVTNGDMLLVTVLGSCVAACICDRQNGIGGMNHFMLPDSGGSDINSPMNPSARYGVYAMEILINHLLKLGARRANLEAKVFGGGNVISGLTQANVGQRNAEFVMQFLNTEGIPITAKDLIDIYPRKVYFFPRTSKVLVKKLKSQHNDTIKMREKDYGRKLNKSTSNDKCNVVELFS
ncbi:MAG: chemoreceptor glutamine deamidase CheD [Nitrosomonas sp.]|nr:chemoreceptor glutamine deamidase CheD [Nitrosomonas sp.]